MSKNISKKILSFLILILIFMPIISVRADVFDNITENLESFNKEAGLKKAPNPLAIIIKILNVILSLLALFFVILVIIGGFKYMTAGGNAETAKDALKLIRDAIIGVAIIIFASVIVKFVLVNLTAIIKPATD